MTSSDTKGERDLVTMTAPKPAKPPRRSRGALAGSRVALVDVTRKPWPASPDGASYRRPSTTRARAAPARPLDGTTGEREPSPSTAPSCRGFKPSPSG